MPLLGVRGFQSILAGKTWWGVSQFMAAGGRGRSCPTGRPESREKTGAGYSLERSVLRDLLLSLRPLLKIPQPP